jgi:hypothetical protein
LRERLSLSGFERFKAERLTQDRLLQIAMTTLESIQKSKAIRSYERQVCFEKRFNFLVNNEGRLATTYDQKKDWFKSTGILPAVYLNHAEFLKDDPSLLQLQMNELVSDGSQTIGYALVEKVLETKNQMALKTLLNTNINLFESPDNVEEPFLVKVLKSKGALKRIVVEYIQQDQRLISLATECLDTHPELKNLFGRFKIHLDDYGTHLVKKDHPSVLLLIAKKILITWKKIVNLENPSEKRGKECGQMYLGLNKCLKVFEQAFTPYETFDEMHKIIIKMKEESMKAIRGIFNSSFLHEESLKLITQFEYALLVSKKSTFDKSINQIKEAHEQEILIFTEEIEKMKVENDHSRLEAAKKEAENVQVKEENVQVKEENVQLKATINALRAQGIHLFFSEPRSANLPYQTREERQGSFPRQ